MGEGPCMFRIYLVGVMSRGALTWGVWVHVRLGYGRWTNGNEVTTICFSYDYSKLVRICTAAIRGISNFGYCIEAELIWNIAQ